jgi:hypothetical protein
MTVRHQKVLPPDPTPSEAAARAQDKDIALLFRAVIGRLSYVDWRDRLPADAWNAMVQVYLWDKYFPSIKDDQKKAWLHLPEHADLDTYREQPEFKAVSDDVEKAFDAVAEEYRSGSYKSMVQSPSVQWKIFQASMQLMEQSRDPKVSQKIIETLTDRIEAKLVARQGEGGDTIFVIQGAHDTHILQRVEEVKKLKEAVVIDGEAEDVTDD